MSLRYFNDLENLIETRSSVDKFVELYKKHFDKEPDQSLIANFKSQISQVDIFETESEYDESYESSYESSYDEPF